MASGHARRGADARARYPRGARARTARALAPLVVSLLLSPPSARAAERLDELVITPPSSAAGDTGAEDDEALPHRTGDVVPEESAVATTRIERTRLIEGGADLARVIERLPGAQTRGAGGFGAAEFVTLRAGTAAQTGVYLDGIRLNGASDPSFDFATLEALDLAAVDVYRGGTPLALGGSDIGGAIDLLTPRDATPSASLRLGAGSFGARSAHAGARAGRGRWRALGAFGSRAADNDFAYTDDNGTRFNPRDDRRVRRANADARRDALVGVLGYRLSATRDADLVVRASARELGVPTPRNRAANDARYADETLALRLSTTLDRLGSGGLWNLRPTLVLDASSSRYDDPDGDVGLGRQRTASDATRRGAKLYAERVGDAGTLALVAEHRAERLDGDDRLRDGRDLVARRSETSVQAEYALWLAAERLALVPRIGYRETRDRVRVAAEAERLRGAPPASSSAETLGGIGLVATPSPRWTFRLNLARHHRMPSFAELFGDSGLLLASPDLVAERGVNLDASVAWRREDEARRTGYRVELGAFSSRRDELIATVHDARGVGRAENLGAARVAGVELEFELEPRPWLAIGGNATAQDTEQRDTLGPFAGKRLPGQAAFAAALRVDVRRGRWRAWYGVDHERERFHDAANLLAAPDATTQHLGLARRLGELELSLSIDNLGDERTEDFRGFVRPGRSVHLGLVWTRRPENDR